MLDEAIKKRKGKKVVVKSNAEVQFNLEAYIPDDYIADQEQKLSSIRKLRGSMIKKRRTISQMN